MGYDDYDSDTGERRFNNSTSQYNNYKQPPSYQKSSILKNSSSLRRVISYLFIF